MIHRQGEQSPVVIISYMGYSPPKCTCLGKQSHPSNYMNLLECLHDQSHVPSPHRLPQLKPNASKIFRFQNKRFLFSKTCYRVLVKYWTTLRGELFDNAPKQSWSSSEVICWTTLQGNSLENLPSKFLSQTFSFFFQFHVMHSLLIF